MTTSSSIRKNASFVDPAIVECNEQSSVFLKHLPQHQRDADDERSIVSSTTSSSSIMQYPKPPTASKSLDHLSSKQEKHDEIEYRVYALEESKRQFESRLQLLEDMPQPLKTEQQHHDNNDDNDDNDDEDNYMELYQSLVEKYKKLEIESNKKETYLRQIIQELTDKLNKETRIEHKEQEAYREEDGYLYFATNMDGQIANCKVKIPPNQLCYNKQEPAYLASPPTTRVNSPQNCTSLSLSQQQQKQQKQLHHHQKYSSLTKGLNPNAPEWTKPIKN